MHAVPSESCKPAMVMNLFLNRPRFIDNLAAVMNKNYGKIIIPHGAYPEPHEMVTANFLTGIGKDVEFIKPNTADGVKNPDIKMDGIIWEIKSPCGKGKGTIERIYKKASIQSENIIFGFKSKLG
jgi:hypothetical protein